MNLMTLGIFTLPFLLKERKRAEVARKRFRRNEKLS